VTWFDLGALAIVVLAAVDGARSGLAWAAVELILIGGAATLTGLLRPLADPYVAKVFEVSQAELPWTTHSLVFVSLALCFTGIAYLLRPLVRNWRFEHDGWPGGVMGAVSGAVLALVLFALATWSGPRAYEEQLTPSHTAWVLTETWDAGITMLFPEQLGRRLEDLRIP
jgi:uncharacterized membrane protein required for colicin V production